MEDEDAKSKLRFNTRKERILRKKKTALRRRRI